MSARRRPEWEGRTPEAMPGIHVLLRLYAKQDGICACGCGVVMNLNRDQVDCDHRVPLRDGGLNIESNLQLMLREHHRIKTVSENVARGKERRHKAKAFVGLKKPTFATNRNGRFKRKIDGTLVDRVTGEPV